MTSVDIPSIISSPESVVGVSHYDSPVGQMTVQSGLAPALANRSVPQDLVRAQAMRATSGPRGIISSRSISLQSCLANRLQARLAERGSVLFALTWKTWAMPWGAPICALRASVLRTSGNASTSLPTPSGTSNHGKNHVAGRLDEWGGSSNPFRGTNLGRLHLPGFELWVMGFPAVWRALMPPAMPSSRKSRKSSLKRTSTSETE